MMTLRDLVADEVVVHLAAGEEFPLAKPRRNLCVRDNHSPEVLVVSGLKTRDPPVEHECDRQVIPIEVRVIAACPLGIGRIPVGNLRPVKAEEFCLREGHVARR